MKQLLSENLLNERRARIRFPLIRAIRYKSLDTQQDVVGQGETLNISSTGALFSTLEDLTPGARVEISVSWPMKLGETTSLKLVAPGRVIWAKDRRAAVQFGTYEFRIAVQPRPRRKTLARATGAPH